MNHVFSPIQNHIFLKLKNSKSLRYSQIQLKDIPNDLFNYHLQFLVKKGFVSKSDRGYALSDLGVKHVADYNPPLSRNHATDLFKINVLTVVSRVHEGKLQILNQIRTSNPSYGKIGVPGGVVRKEEPMEIAASRKLMIETGLEAKFKLIGIQRRIMYVNGELFSDILFPIAYADSVKGELISHTEYGHNIWVPIGEAIKNELAPFDTIKKIPDVLRAIKNKKIKKLPFFYDEDVQKGIQ
jgi:hypothetical protein